MARSKASNPDTNSTQSLSRWKLYSIHILRLEVEVSTTAVAFMWFGRQDTNFPSPTAHVSLRRTTKRELSHAHERNRIRGLPKNGMEVLVDDNNLL